MGFPVVLLWGCRDLVLPPVWGFLIHGVVGGVSVVLGVCFVLLLVTCVPSLLGSSLCGVLPICGAGLVVCLYGVMGWGWSMMVRVRFGCLGWVVCDEGYVGAERCGVWVGGCGSYCGECCAGGYDGFCCVAECFDWWGGWCFVGLGWRYVVAG